LRKAGIQVDRVTGTHVNTYTSTQVDKYTGTQGGVAFDYELDPSEIELIEAISRFPAEVQRAAEENKPLIIASHGYEVAKAFASFYDKCPVIQAEEKVRAARLELVMAARQAMANALNLLGIQAPDVM
jgi:arginyl-tRNA synthetase